MSRKSTSNYMKTTIGPTVVPQFVSMPPVAE